MAGSVLFDPSDTTRPLPQSTGGSYPAAVIYRGEVAEFKVVFTLWNFQGSPAIEISVGHPSFGTGWNDWSEEKEQKKLEWLKSFLVNAGASIGVYSWGKVTAQYDPKNASSSAWISYAQQGAQIHSGPSGLRRTR